LCFERVLSPEEIRLAADRTPALLWKAFNL
jgi:hypothetical protein